MTAAPVDLATLRADLDRALVVLADRHDDYVKGREYYDGTRAEVFASKSVEKALKATAKNTPISLAHIPVDVIIDKVELASLAAEDEAANTILKTVVDESNLEDEADDMLKKAGYFGDYYGIVDPSLEDSDGNIIPDSIRIVGSSPLTTVVLYDPKDERTALYGAKVWRKGKKWRALLYYDNGTWPLVTPEVSAETEAKAEQFEPDVELGKSFTDAFIPHPGGRMLVHHLSIDGKPYGTPLHKKAWGPQDAITKISATNLNNVDAQGFPSRWALSDPLAQIDDDIDDDFGNDGPTTTADNSDGLTKATTGSSRVRTIPGAINLLKGIKAVGQFENTTSEDFLKNMDWYIRVMAVACGVALFEFDMNGEQPSGESRRRAEGRANKKAAKVKRAAGAFFKEIGDTVLALVETTGVVAATFNPSETATDKDGMELVSLKIKTGVPVRQALLEAGYTGEQVDEWFPMDNPHITPEVLQILAAALQQLGQAKTLGVISDQELREMLPDILTAARGEGAASAASVVPVKSPVVPAAGDIGQVPRSA